MKKQACDPVSIGKRLVELRGIRTRVGVAREVGITNSALASFERGERVPRDDDKIRLSEYYHVPVQQLFFEKD